MIFRITIHIHFADISVSFMNIACCLIGYTRCAPPAKRLFAFIANVFIYKYLQQWPIKIAIQIDILRGVSEEWTV